MGRLIEVQDVDAVPVRLTLRVGDVLWVAVIRGARPLGRPATTRRRTSSRR